MLVLGYKRKPAGKFVSRVPPWPLLWCLSSGSALNSYLDFPSWQIIRREAKSFFLCLGPGVYCSNRKQYKTQH